MLQRSFRAKPIAFVEAAISLARVMIAISANFLVSPMLTFVALAATVFKAIVLASAAQTAVVFAAVVLTS